MKYTKEQVLAIIGENEATENWIFEPMEVPSQCRNRLRVKQRALLEKYEMGMKAADESSRAQREIMKKPKKTREVIKYC